MLQTWLKLMSLQSSPSIQPKILVDEVVGREAEAIEALAETEVEEAEREVLTNIQEKLSTIRVMRSSSLSNRTLPKKRSREEDEGKEAVEVLEATKAVLAETNKVADLDSLKTTRLCQMRRELDK
jgi:hypothetical protein